MGCFAIVIPIAPLAIAYKESVAPLEFAHRTPPHGEINAWTHNASQILIAWGQKATVLWVALMALASHSRSLIIALATKQTPIVVMA